MHYRNKNRNQTEYDSDYDMDKKVEKAKNRVKMLNAHAELLNFFANVSDEESSEELG